MSSSKPTDLLERKINYLKLRDWVSPVGVISTLNKMTFDDIVKRYEAGEELKKHDIIFIHDIYELY